MPEKAQQDAVAAYRGMWQDFVEAGQTSDWRSAKLGHHATGLALTNMSRALYADHYNGLVTKGEPVLNPQAFSADPADDPKKIIISDCGDSTRWVKYRADSGQPLDGKPGGRRRINAIVEKQPGLTVATHRAWIHQCRSGGWALGNYESCNRKGVL
ncbi:hypothetical protein GCM10012275_43520 [Longimycelium tulufanense]|uniref:Uncharacterized protein n=1 Tax=Longimycelium tulufanense TaxID=907463 RepID=A0A8J3CB54_9PSEU|nr:hypothetical protein GCM10012275_43520 [Longimycelium tulufanense]